MDRPLNRRQQKFCRFYIECGIATEAAEKAGYAPKHISKYAHYLLTNRRVALAVSDMRAAHIKKTDITLEKIVAQLWLHASSGERDKETVSALNSLLKYAENVPLEGDEKNTIKLAYSLPPKKEEVKKEEEKIQRMSDEEIKKEMEPDIDPELGF